MHKKRSRQTGLTLVELLVAISVLAFVAVLGWRGLDSIVRARIALNADLENTRGMQLAFAQLQNDCANIVNPTPLANNRGPILARQEELYLIRAVFADNQPSRLQVVSYRIRDGRLIRQQSVPTRDLSVLEQNWLAMVGGNNLMDAVELQSDISAMRMRLWSSTANMWVPAESISPTANAGSTDSNNSFAQAKARAAATLTGMQQWSGLEVALQLTGQQSSMVKVFLLGTV
jgi:general secretion pathway protein J